LGTGRAVYNKIRSAKTNTKSDPIKDGEYLFLIKNLILKEMNEGETFVAELKVLERKSKGDRNPLDGTPVVPNAAGTTTSYVQKIGKFLSAAGNTKSFLIALVGATEEEVDQPDPEKPGKTHLDSLLDECFSEEGHKTQPYRGALIRGTTYQQTTKSGPNAGKMNTYVRFTCVDGQDTASVAKNRAALDAEGGGTEQLQEE